MQQYDSYLTQYQAAMINIEQLAATLNAGQAAILNVGIVAALVTAVRFTTGGISPGDLILIQGMLLQLWAPLQFLGWFFRCGLLLHLCRSLRQHCCFKRSENAWGCCVWLQNKVVVHGASATAVDGSGATFGKHAVVRVTQPPCRELRQSLVDMEDFLAILKRRPANEDGTEELRILERTPGHAAATPRDAEHSRAEANGAAAGRPASSHAASAASTSSDRSEASDSDWGHDRSEDEWEAEQALCAPDERVQGLAIEFDNVSFGYTDDRLVRKPRTPHMLP